MAEFPHQHQMFQTSCLGGGPTAPPISHVRPKGGSHSWESPWVAGREGEGVRSGTILDSSTTRGGKITLPLFQQCSLVFSYLWSPPSGMRSRRGLMPPGADEGACMLWFIGCGGTHTPAMPRPVPSSSAGYHGMSLTHWFLLFSVIRSHEPWVIT